MSVVTQAFQVYLDTVTSTMKMCAYALIHLNIGSKWPQTLSTLSAHPCSRKNAKAHVTVLICGLQRNLFSSHIGGV
jgi:hypothetical protein